ncbi:hypothetical protein BS50DRAFT_579894 [Corynespora cassiicola Philippines]|uniref:Geranylgeranyl pyrophosphate synthetase n=1 Tax=Corynespora cassiicola Philippines TaxID=1448308 RepID=A0A2T2N2N3_CORCC|nr:hypothetical protein BS50DRAFT_579894 [Corynespora cassiicola Philippines]
MKVDGHFHSSLQVDVHQEHGNAPDQVTETIKNHIAIPTAAGKLGVSSTSMVSAVTHINQDPEAALSGSALPDQAEDLVTAPAAKKRKPDRNQEFLLAGLGDIIQDLNVESITPSENEIKWDGDAELVCSYNWRDVCDGQNQIFVPGGPPKWAPPKLPLSIPQDTGISYKDSNYVRQPRQPYKPMFAALDKMQLRYSFSTADVIVDRNNIRNLWDVMMGRTSFFRLDLYLINNTLVIGRKERNFEVHSRAGQGGGYGRNFEKNFTIQTDELKDTDRHYRVIRYPFGKLDLVLRFEADAYHDPDSLLEDEARLPVENGDPEQRRRWSVAAPIQVIDSQSPSIPCSKIAELKSQIQNADKDRGISRKDALDQVWFGRTPHLFHGVHDRETGAFLYTQYTDAKEASGRWASASRHQEALQKVESLLTQLRDLLKSRAQNGDGTHLILMREDKTRLQLRAPMNQDQWLIDGANIRKYWQGRQNNHPRNHHANRRQPYRHFVPDFRTPPVPPRSSHEWHQMQSWLNPSIPNSLNRSLNIPRNPSAQHHDNGQARRGRQGPHGSNQHGGQGRGRGHWRGRGRGDEHDFAQRHERTQYRDNPYPAPGDHGHGRLGYD